MPTSPTKRSWTIVVPGKPQPAGSKRAYAIRRKDEGDDAEISEEPD